MGHVSDLGSLPLKDNLLYILSLLAIGSMYGIYANIWGILMVNVTIYSIHGSYGLAYEFPFWVNNLSRLNMDQHGTCTAGQDQDRLWRGATRWGAQLGMKQLSSIG